MPAATSAHDIAAELRRRLPGVGTKKLHKLLYYCQGHHLAAFNQPLFAEQVAAWDMGPVVAELWRDENRGHQPPPPRQLGEAELNTVGYVLSRYGNLTGNDLERLAHNETPWQIADSNRAPRGSVTIRHEWIRDYFRSAGAPGDEEDEPVLDTAVVRAWLVETLKHPTPTRVDDLDALRARATAGV